MALRVLHILNSLEGGGAETFIMNVYRAIDKDKIQFDFLIRSKNNREDLLKEINQYGGKVFIMPAFPREYFANKRKTEEFFRKYKKEYSVVHIHANALLYILPLKLASMNNIKTIIHSHNTKTNVPILMPIHLFNKKRINRYENIKLACGDEAGKWMFEDEFEVVHNAVDVSKFRFNSIKRKNFRKEFGIDDNITVIGHVGRFVAAKNHEYIIDIYNEYQKKYKNTVLLLVGSGILENKIKEKVNSLNLDKKVIFAGMREDSDAAYQAMDILLFPSLFEGLPFVLIEAQSSGLPILAADTISKAVDITGLVHFMDLNCGVNSWVRSLTEIIMHKEEREKYANTMSGTKYDIKYSTQRLFEIYRGEMLK